MVHTVLNIDAPTQLIIDELQQYFGEKSQEDVFSTALALAKLIAESAGDSKTCQIEGENHTKITLELRRPDEHHCYGGFDVRDKSKFAA